MSKHTEFLKMDHEIASMSSIRSSSEKYAFQDKIVEAGFRISSFILAKAWLKRCQDTNDLNAKVNSITSECHKSHEILEAKKAHYYQKQHENEELTCQIRMTQKEIERLKVSIKEIVPKVDNLEDKKNSLLLQFSSRCDECINTNMQISDFKLKMMEILEKNKEIEAQIETEKSKAEKISEKADKLNDELVEFKAHSAKSEESLLRKIETVESEIQRTKDKKKELKYKVMELKKFTDECESTKTNTTGASMELKKALLRQQAAILREALEQTFESKIRKHGMIIISILIEVVKVILPAFPKPKNENCLIENSAYSVDLNASEC